MSQSATGPAGSRVRGYFSPQLEKSLVRADYTVLEVEPKAKRKQDDFWHLHAGLTGLLNRVYDRLFAGVSECPPESAPHSLKQKIKQEEAKLNRH